MAELTEEQEAYLISHGIPLSAVFDAEGIWTPEKRCIQIMKDLGKWIAYGTNPCRKAGHTLYTRRRACIQCNPAAIAFMRRSIESGYVYVAGSLTKEIIKVGTSNNPERRVYALNNEEVYAGVSDWELLYAVRVNESGKVEFNAHRLLDTYAAPETYTYRGREMHCLETFHCGLSRAVSVIGSIVDLGSVDAWMTDSTSYEFPETIGHRFYREGNLTSNVRSGSVQNTLNGPVSEPKTTDIDPFTAAILELEERGKVRGSISVEEILAELPEEYRMRENYDAAVFTLQTLKIEITGDPWDVDLPSKYDLEDDVADDEASTAYDENGNEGASGVHTAKSTNTWYDLMPDDYRVEELLDEDDELSDETLSYIIGLFDKLRDRSIIQAVLRIESLAADRKGYSLSRSILQNSELASQASEEEGNERPASLAKIIMEVLETLPPAEAMTIKCAYGIGDRDHGLSGMERWSFSVVGDRVGLSARTVSPLIKKGIRRLRHPSRERKLRKHYGAVIRLKMEHGDDFVDHLSREQSLLVAIFGIPAPDLAPDPF